MLETEGSLWVYSDPSVIRQNRADATSPKGEDKNNLELALFDAVNHHSSCGTLICPSGTVSVQNQRA